MSASRKSSKSQKSTKAAAAAVLETLEGRTMFSSVMVYNVPTSAGMELLVQGTAANDNITVTQSGFNLTVWANGANKTFAGPHSSIVVHGNAGNDNIMVARNVTTPAYIYGDAGGNVLITGASNDKLYGGAGSDKMVAIGGRNNTFYAGSGHDNLWSGPGNYYYSGGGTITKHFFSSFLNTRDMSLDGASISEPGLDLQDTTFGGYENVSNLYLFGNNGPTPSDVNQGAEGTCYFLSSLAAVAMQDSQRIRDMITPLGDGTYAVQFYHNGEAYIVREDAKLPHDDAGNLCYAGLGSNNSTWVALIEKGYAYFHSWELGRSASYAAISGGFGNIALAALGGGSIFDTRNPSHSFWGGQDMASWIDSQLRAGRAVDIGFANDVNGQIYGSHEYTVNSVVWNTDGTVAGLWVRNPWGVDLSTGLAAPGHNDGHNDGYVFISPDVAFFDCNDLASATV